MRSRATLPLLLFCCLLAGACGSSAKSTTMTTAAGGTSTGVSETVQAARVRAAVCMRAHGIAFPDPVNALSNPAGFLKAVTSITTSSPAYKAAAPGCRAQALKAGSG